MVKHKRYVMAITAVTALCAISTTTPGGAQTRSPAAPKPAPVTTPAGNLMAEAARSVGVSRCLPVVSRLSAQALEGSTAHDVLIDRDKVQPDASAFFGLLVSKQEQSPVVTSLTAVPDRGGSCTVMAERIVVAPATCVAVAEGELQGYTRTPLLPGVNVYTTASDPSATVSLFDTTTGCLVIRRHVKYQWQDPAIAARTPSATGAPMVPSAPSR